jgi:phosphoribosylformylglycinamidine (FGAM) synthase-like enzyme
MLVFAGNLLLSGHDVSDGGLISCLLEMAFAGNCGISVDFPLPEPSKSSCYVFTVLNLIGLLLICRKKRCVDRKVLI